MKQSVLTVLAAVVAVMASSCSKTLDVNQSRMLVSVADQQMLLTQHGQPVKMYPVSTSKFGVGDTPRSMRTPLGSMQVARKIGHGHTNGAVFKRRRPTGEVIAVDAPGRDPIVTRILWLKGTEKRNKNAFGRYIYIHGTPEERNVGKVASYGCIRMKSKDIVDLYSRIGVNSEVKVIRGSLKYNINAKRYAKMHKEVKPHSVDSDGKEA